MPSQAVIKHLKAHMLERDWGIGFSFRPRRKTLCLLIATLSPFALLLVVWLALITVVYTHYVVTTYITPISYTYSDWRVDASVGDVEIGTVFIQTNREYGHEHNRCYGIFRRLRGDADHPVIVCDGASVFPDPPYRPGVKGVDDLGVTYLLEEVGSDGNVRRLHVPFRPG